MPWWGSTPAMSPWGSCCSPCSAASPLPGCSAGKTSPAPSSSPGTGTSSTGCGSWSSPSSTWWADEPPGGSPRCPASGQCGGGGAVTAPQSPATIEQPGTIEQPAPAVWPMGRAFGVTVICAGLVRHGIVSVVGAILTLAAGVGWWRQVLPEPRVEHVVVPPLLEGVPARPAARPAVRRLTPGEAGHRVRIPVEVQPISSGGKGGAVGGAARAIVALTYGIVMQQSLWYPINLLAGVAIPGMAQAGMAELRAFDLTALIIGIIAHGVISVLAGLLYALILPM